MAFTQHRASRIQDTGAHPAGMRNGFSIVETPTGSDPPPFSGVALPDADDPRFPTGIELPHHWLNVSKWRVVFNLTLDGSYGLASVVTSKTVDLYTGTTAEVDDAGTITLSDTVEVDRVELYKGGVITEVNWAGACTEAGPGSTEYAHDATLLVQIAHGTTAFHNDLGSWLMHLKAVAVANVDNNEVVTESPYDVTSSDSSPTCDSGWEWDGVGPSGPDGGGNFTWTCVPVDPNVSGSATLQVDPDGAATEGTGTMLSKTIKWKYSETDGGKVPDLALTLTITALEYYDAWF